jgi:hypothetical protein
VILRLALRLGALGLFDAIFATMHVSEHAIFACGARHPIARRICERTIGSRVDPAFSTRDVDSIAFALSRWMAWKTRGHSARVPSARARISSSGRIA